MVGFKTRLHCAEAGAKDAFGASEDPKMSLTTDEGLFGAAGVTASVGPNMRRSKSPITLSTSSSFLASAGLRAACGVKEKPNRSELALEEEADVGVAGGTGNPALAPAFEAILLLLLLLLPLLMDLLKSGSTFATDTFA